MSGNPVHRPIPQPVPRIAAVPEIGQNLLAPQRDGPRPSIVMTFGPQGIGKTALLHQLDHDLDQKTPRALLDCATYEQGEIPRLLTDAKLQFSRPCPGIGRLRFRRLEIGLASTRTPIDFGSSQRIAFRKLADLIIREIYPLPTDGGGGIGPDDRIPVPSWLQTLIWKLFALVARPLSRTMLQWLLRRPWRWHGHRDQQLPSSAIDELAELNTWAHAPAQHGKRDERLIEALLADIRDAFSRGTLAKPGWYNCVLLLDNADTDVGQTLLRHLGVLRERLQIASVAAEPLLVVAASDRELPGKFLTQYRVPEFTEPEVAWLARYLPDEIDHRFHKVLYQFTSGYPAAAAFITEAAGRHPDAAAGSSPDTPAKSLDTLLAVRLDSGTPSVEEQVMDTLMKPLLKQLNRPLPDDALDELMTCSLARDQADGDWLARNHADSTAIDPTMLADTLLWGETGPTGAYELLRLLLLRRLSVREAGLSKLDWPAICDLLADRRHQFGDLHGELYYLLARGEFGPVVHRLTGCLAGHDIEGPWIDLLKFVSTAPRRNITRDHTSPYEQQIHLARTVADDDTPHLLETARLVAGLWLANDPSTPPDRNYLHEQIALDYRLVAPDADHPMSLRSEATRHEALAHDWS